jgi:hypothetical protein
MWRWPCPTFRAMADAFAPHIADIPADAVAEDLTNR